MVKGERLCGRFGGGSSSLSREVSAARGPPSMSVLSRSNDAVQDSHRSRDDGVDQCFAVVRDDAVAARVGRALRVERALACEARGEG